MLIKQEEWRIIDLIDETNEKYDIIQIIDTLERLLNFAKGKLREIEVR